MRSLEALRSPAATTGWPDTAGSCCGVAATRETVAALGAATRGRFALCASLELQVSISVSGLRFDRVGCFWPATAMASPSAFDDARDRFFAAEGVPPDVRAWAQDRVDALTIDNLCGIVGFGSDGERRSKVYVEEFSFDADWQGRLQQQEDQRSPSSRRRPALLARVWDPQSPLVAAKTAAKRYEHLAAEGTAAQLARALPFFREETEDAASVAEALRGLGMYNIDSSTRSSANRTLNRAWAMRFDSEAAHADPRGEGARAFRKRARAGLDAAEPALGRFLGLRNDGNPCGRGEGAAASRASSWLACADALVSEASPAAFVNNLQLSRSNSAGEPYLTLYYTARTPDTARRLRWLERCCRLSGGTSCEQYAAEEDRPAEEDSVRAWLDRGRAYRAAHRPD